MLMRFLCYEMVVNFGKGSVNVNKINLALEFIKEILQFLVR